MLSKGICGKEWGYSQNLRSSYNPGFGKEKDKTQGRPQGLGRVVKPLGSLGYSTLATPLQLLLIAGCFSAQSSDSQARFSLVCLGHMCICVVL